MWIENVAAADISKGFHHDCGPNSMLIQIMDPCSSWWPKPIHEFKEVHQFEFLDIEVKDKGSDEFGITAEQAKEIVRLLRHALDNCMNVVVHCHAGICRSGAVVEVGVIMGFNDPGRYRAPNLMVKHALMKELGLTYDSDEKLYAVFEDPTFGGSLSNL